MESRNSNPWCELPYAGKNRVCSLDKLKPKELKIIANYTMFKGVNSPDNKNWITQLGTGRILVTMDASVASFKLYRPKVPSTVGETEVCGENNNAVTEVG